VIHVTKKRVAGPKPNQRRKGEEVTIGCVIKITPKSKWRQIPELTMKCPDTCMRRWGTRWWTAVCITVRRCDMPRNLSRQKKLNDHMVLAQGAANLMQRLARLPATP
jgi:hypothetical protein